MKKICTLALFLVAGIAQAQISVQGNENGSITITPKGLQGSSNSAAGGGNLAVGSNALKNTVYDNVTTNFRNGSGNTAVGIHPFLQIFREPKIHL